MKRLLSDRWVDARRKSASRYTESTFAVEMGSPKIHVDGYGIEPQNYFMRGANMLADAIANQWPNTLFYVAFEFRCSIEQVLKLYLELLEPDSWSKKIKKLYSAKDLQRTILEFEPEFYRKLKFVDILVKAVGNKGVYMIDLDELSTHYGKIGIYLHAQQYPLKTVKNDEWWGRFFSILQDAGDYLEAVLTHDLAVMSMNEVGWDLYEKWKSGVYSDQEVREEFLKGLYDPDSV